MINTRPFRLRYTLHITVPASSINQVISTEKLFRWPLDQWSSLSTRTQSSRNRSCRIYQQIHQQATAAQLFRLPLLIHDHPSSHIWSRKSTTKPSLPTMVIFLINDHPCRLWDILHIKGPARIINQNHHQPISYSGDPFWSNDHPSSHIWSRKSTTKLAQPTIYSAGPFSTRRHSSPHNRSCRTHQPKSPLAVADQLFRRPHLIKWSSIFTHLVPQIHNQTKHQIINYADGSLINGHRCRKFGPANP